MLEFCLEVTFLARDGGVPPTETGTLPIANIPETDAEFVEAGITTLQELGWWQKNSYLMKLSRRFDCAQVLQPTHQHILYFHKTSRTSLLTEHIQYATLIFTDAGTELEYRLEDYGTVSLRSRPRLDLDKVQITSNEALKQAEVNGGKALRDLVKNACYIYMDISQNGIWEVDYSQNQPFDRLLCFNIDANTQTVKQVAERSFNECQYFDRIP
jgi:hypothetical protein